MALTNYAAFKASTPHAQVSISKSAIATATAGRLMSMWTAAPLAGATITTAAVPDFSTTGALYRSPTGLATWLRDFVLSKFQGGTVIIYDRLSHQGGLSGTVTTAQTTNLPTAALTRFTSGVGVMAALECYTVIGTTATTITMSYTNSAGTASRTAPLFTYGGASDSKVGTFVPIPLQIGDVGVKSVENVTLTATTAVAGAFGVTLWKPLACFNVPSFNQHVSGDAIRDLGAMFESFPSDACLSMLVSANGTSTGSVAGNINLIKQV